MTNRCAGENFGAAKLPPGRSSESDKCGRYPTGSMQTSKRNSSGGSRPATVSRVAVEETGMRFEQVVNRVFAMLTEMRLGTVVAVWAGGSQWQRMLLRAPHEAAFVVRSVVTP